MSVEAGLIGAVGSQQGWDAVQAVFSHIKTLAFSVLVEQRDEIEATGCKIIDAVDIPRVPAMFERPIKAWLKMQLDWTLDNYIANDAD